MAIFDVEVVIRPKDIGRDDGGEGTAVLPLYFILRKSKDILRKYYLWVLICLV